MGGHLLAAKRAKRSAPTGATSGPPRVPQEGQKHPRGSRGRQERCKRPFLDTSPERMLDKFSRFSYFRKRPNTFFLGIFGGFGSYFQILWDFLRRLRSVSSQKTTWGPILGQIRISPKTGKLVQQALRSFHCFVDFSTHF